MFDFQVERSTEIDLLHRLEVLAVFPDLVDRVTLLLTRRILTEDVECCEARMRRSDDVD